ncbi:hypothetical protein MPLDJ20_140019 [Mesorhizobium plurifarium]|uniref:Uncharacterized protein n=1 Tax=Mesorhizobium plurifarium TaxID=69974 RepID=A0A090EP59_MESPL|nr:hypothetical protein MPLDJ20_140019 [Mesorhizobium plurifarium]
MDIQRSKGIERHKEPAFTSGVISGRKAAEAARRRIFNEGNQTWLTIKRDALEPQAATVTLKIWEKSAYRRAAKGWTIF